MSARRTESRLCACAALSEHDGLLSCAGSVVFITITVTKQSHGVDSHQHRLQCVSYTAGTELVFIVFFWRQSIAQIGGSVAKCFRVSSVLFVVAVWSALPALSTARTQFVAPPKRAHHALVYDGQRQRVLLAGGNSPMAGGESYTSFNDLWAFDGMRWAALPSSGLQMWGMRLAFDSRRRRVLSFGGNSDRRSISDVRVLENDVWTTLGQHSEMPAADAGFVSDSRRDRFIAFGGSVGDGSAYGDTWSSPAAHGPRSRRRARRHGRPMRWSSTNGAGEPSSLAARARMVRINDHRGWEMSGSSTVEGGVPGSSPTDLVHARALARRMTRNEASPSSSAASTPVVSSAICGRGPGPSGGNWLVRHPPARLHEPWDNSLMTKGAIESSFSAGARDGRMVT